MFTLLRPEALGVLNVVAVTRLAPTLLVPLIRAPVSFECWSRITRIFSAAAREDHLSPAGVALTVILTSTFPLLERATVTLGDRVPQTLLPAPRPFTLHLAAGLDHVRGWRVVPLARTFARVRLALLYSSAVFRLLPSLGVLSQLIATHPAPLARPCPLSLAPGDRFGLACRDLCAQTSPRLASAARVLGLVSGHRSMRTDVLIVRKTAQASHPQIAPILSSSRGQDQWRARILKPRRLRGGKTERRDHAGTNEDRRTEAQRRDQTSAVSEHARDPSSQEDDRS